MSDSYFDHRSFPNEYTIDFESSLCLRLKSFLSTGLSLKRTNEQFLTVERSCRAIHLQVSALVTSSYLSIDNLFFEEYSFVLISSALLVQPDEGVLDLVVDRIGDNLPQSTEKSRIIVIPVGARHKCQRVASFASSRHGFPDARIEEVAKRSSRSDKSAAKQLTTYEELSKLDVNC
ncbi:hypothetical protein F511_17100 [Dorcoceras hygrometricum]|uniref:Uncharacterized protein n=1 Tax=Dorcoceras hygrometricum TaxID=472368 RepID=A0A2Z7B5Z5_9LAMI|nr:hypothetical protein F511_17100 [Dorcoceras hygrometricum]